MGKTAQSKTGPYRIVDKLGDVLLKLQDVQFNAILTSWKHGDVLSYQPAEESSNLRQLQRDHEHVAEEAMNRRLQDAVDQGEGDDELPGVHGVEDPAGQDINVEPANQRVEPQRRREDDRRPRPFTVKTPDTNVQDIVAMPQIKVAKQVKKRSAKPGLATRGSPIRSPSPGLTRAMKPPSTHVMHLRGSGARPKTD